MMRGQVQTQSPSMCEGRDGQAFLPSYAIYSPAQSSPPTYLPDVKLIPTLLASERSTLPNSTDP